MPFIFGNTIGKSPTDAYYGTLANIGGVEAQDIANKTSAFKLDQAQQIAGDTRAAARSLADVRLQQAQPPAGLSATAPQDTGDYGPGERPGGLADVGATANPAPTLSPAQTLLKDANDMRDRALALEKLGTPTAANMAMDVRKQADQALERAAPLLKDEFVKHEKAFTQAGNMLYGVKSPEELLTAYNTMEPEARDKFFSKVPKDLAGNPIFTQTDVQAANTVGTQFLSAADNLKNQNRALEDRIKAQDADRKIAADAEKARHNVATEANQREGLAKKPDASSSALTPDAIDAAAEKYRLTGNLPAIGIGQNAAMTKAAILNRASEQAAQSGESGEAQAIRQVANKTNQTALSQVTKQADMVGAFEKNALKNLDLALSASDKVDRTGVPVLNRWLLAGQKELAGDPDVSRFHAANTTFINEYAKIMSGSMGNTPVSDSLRKETESLLATKDTPAQYKAATDLMKQEMANRIKGFNEQKAEITSRMKAPSSTGFVEGAVYQDGDQYAKYSGGKWIPVPKPK